MSLHASPPANCISGTCQTNGIDVHFLRTGGGKPPLLVLHGLIGSGACLLPLARALASDVDVLLPDARGHGLSSAPAHGYSYADHAADAMGLIGALDLDAPVLLGHSMGGLTAALVASRPETRISGLVLVDPTFISPEWQREVYESEIAAEHGNLQALPRPELLALARKKSPQRSIEMIEHLADARLRTSLGAFEVLAPPNPDYRELVRRIRVPVLLVIGERGVVSLETAQELARLNPLLRYELMADSGHGLPYDEPDGLSSIVLSFLRQLAASGMRRAD